MPNRDEWSITCRDLAGRRRDVTVFVSSDKVVLVAPPGEAVVLGPLDVGRLRAALRDAVVVVAQNQEDDAYTSWTRRPFPGHRRPHRGRIGHRSRRWVR